MKTSHRIRMSLATLAGFLLLAVLSDCWAVRPYTPVHPDPVLEPWRWRSFPELKGQDLWCMAEDKDGNLWFGVDDGVMRYDGLKWVTYTSEDGLLSAPVTALCVVQDGSVYAGTERGISRFNEGNWSRVYPPEGDLPWHIWDLTETSDGSLWAGTYLGVLRLDPNGAILFTTKQIGTAMRGLAPYVQLSIIPSEVIPERSWSSAGVLIRTEGWHVGGTSKVVWALAPGGPGATAGLRVGDRIIKIDGRADWWALSGSAGTSVTLTVQRKGTEDPFEVILTRGQVEGTFRHFWVYDILEDRDGALWFGLGTGEILRWNIRGTQPGDAPAWRLYTEKDGLDIAKRARIAHTRDGTIWTVSGVGRGGVNRFNGKTWKRVYLKPLGGSDIVSSIIEAKDGALWVGGLGCLHAYRNGGWRVYKMPEVPIPDIHIFGLLETSDEVLWIATKGQEALRLDLNTSRWTTYKGLSFQCETQDGSRWFVSRDSGIVRNVGNTWTRYGLEDGQMDCPTSLIITPEGMLWAAGSHDSTAATAWFDGGRWFLQTHSQLAWSIESQATYASSDGALWFSARPGFSRERGHRGGVLRFHPPGQTGKTWTHYVPPWFAFGIGETADGVLWFGSTNSLRRFDGLTWTRVMEPKELIYRIDALHSGARGDLWIGHSVNGVFHYDGKTWARYTVHNGVADGRPRSIFEANDGSVWVTTTKGVSRFDGRAWVTNALPPGLEGALRQSQDGAFWVNSGDRTTRYESSIDPPETEITQSLSKISQPGNTTLAWRGTSSWRATPDEELQFAYRLDRGEWSPFSRDTYKTFFTLPSGEHTFEVKARDRNFNEDSTPAIVHFTVVPPVWRQVWFVGMVVAFLGIAGFQATRIVSRTRERDRVREALLEEAEEELKTAHDLQMKLMPTEHPRIKGLDIAGRCIPANHVGGDFFQYFDPEGKLVLAMADVTGHAMEAAIPVVMFSGILDNQMEEHSLLEERFEKLNRSLYRNLDARTFVCLVMAEFDLDTHTFCLSNGGCPYPYHFQAPTGELVELQLDAYPLGVRSETVYEVVELQLLPGDRVVFCSDGIIEAENTTGEMFGYERTAETIRQACVGGLSAEATSDRIFDVVKTFRGDASQVDDMTCVVVRVDDADGH